jgi:multidrug efflux system outer membrane protein
MMSGAGWLWRREKPRSALVSRATVVAGLACTLALGGCIPNLVTPDAALDVPDTYRFAGPKAGLEDHATDWWRTFRSPELTKFMEETEVANLDIAVAIAQVEQADALARQSGAALLPTISATDTATRSLSSNSLVSGVSTSSGTGTTTSSIVTGSTSNSARTDLVASFGASYQLDFWGRNRALYKSAQETATADRWNRQTVQLTSLASTATTYYTILAARERIAFVKQNISDSSRILKLIQDRLAAGTATALDEAQQAALVANLKASIPPLQVVSDQNVAALAVLLGRAPEHIAVAGKSVLNAPVPVIAPGIPSEVLTLRPDVEFAEANLASAHANLVAARAAFFPTLTLTAQGGFESLALKTLFSPASTFYTAAFSLAQPIFDGGLLRGEYDQVKGRQNELLADYRKSVISAFSDVDKALIALRLYAQQEELTRQSLAASRKAYQLSEDRLRGGVLDVVTLLQTEQTLFTTQDTLVQVRLSRLTEAVALYQALGGAYAGRARTAR